jgi:hypothetical protein
MSGAEMSAADMLAAALTRSGWIDAAITDGDGNPLPAFTAGQAIGFDLAERIRSSDSAITDDSTLAVVLCVAQMKDRALLAGLCRALQAAIEGRAS